MQIYFVPYVLNICLKIKEKEHVLVRESVEKKRPNKCFGDKLTHFRDS